MPNQINGHPITKIAEMSVDGAWKFLKLSLWEWQKPIISDMIKVFQFMKMRINYLIKLKDLMRFY